MGGIHHSLPRGVSMYSGQRGSTGGSTFSAEHGFVIVLSTTFRAEHLVYSHNMRRFPGIIFFREILARAVVIETYRVFKSTIQHTASVRYS